ncbi:MAG: FtsQ-type POTRA domain-containing protein [Deltaproteobacteria bacterium]|nr:FtsQ-type POTRA domain-containing protein [Deltaproteobacteria bacterium]
MAEPKSLPANRRVRAPSMPPGGVIDAPGEDYEPPEDAPIAAPDRNARKPASKPKAQRGPSVLSAIVRRAQPIVGLLVVVAASIAVAWGIRHHVMTSPRFAVRTVRVEGTVKRSSEQIAAAAGLKIGNNIFSIDLESARVRILQDPWIEKAMVRRKLPSTITVEVTEREASAAVVVGTEIYLCTHDGELFKTIEPGDPSNLVVITGLTSEQVSDDRPGSVKRIRAALDLMMDYEQRGPSKRLALEEINLAQDGTVRLVVGKEAVTLEMGQSPFRQKILRAAQVLQEVDRRHAQPSVVFLDNDAHPERVVVRMR